MESVNTSPWKTVPFYIGTITARSGLTGTRDSLTFSFFGRSVLDPAQTVALTNQKNYANPWPTAEVEAAAIGTPAIVWPTSITNEPYHLWTEYKVVENPC